MSRRPRGALTESIAELVSSAAARWPDDVAIACGGSRLTYSQLDRGVARMAQELIERGLEPGDPVAVLAGTGLEFPVLAHGVLRAGGVLVPISPGSPPHEVATLLRTSRAQLVLCDRERQAVATGAVDIYDPACGVLVLDARARRGGTNLLVLSRLTAGRELPAPPPRVSAGTPAVVLFTSGSTARPKGVVHSHEGLLHNARCVAFEMIGLTRKDVMLGALPLAHSFGLSAVLNTSLLVGSRLELLPNFDAGEAWKLVLAREVTVLTGVPTMYRRIAELREASRNSDLRLAIVSGAPCPRGTARDIRVRLGVPMIERYGMTEASPLTWRTLDDGVDAGDVGWPAWGVRLRAIDPTTGRVLPAGQRGLLEVRSPGMLMRYLRDSDNRAQLRDGWLRTGDLGTVRADRGLSLQGRVKEVILRGGYTVSAAEIEAALGHHPAVADAVVVGVPDADLGEEIAAMVVLKAGRRAEPAELGRFLFERLAEWKCPRRWRLVDDLPRSPLGKVLRDEVARRWAGSDA